MAIADLQGNLMTGADTEAGQLYCEAASAFNLYRGDPVGLLDRAIAMAPRFAMARIFRTYLFALATEPDLTREASAALDGLRAMPMNERESSHVAIIERIVTGRWTEAGLALDRHNAAYPRDLVGIQVGHLVDFYRANARNLRDRIARVLPQWSPSDPGYPTMLGFYAFGLEEMADYARAEAFGREAVEREPLECWAHHAVAHVMEMQGRAEDGLGWMMAREAAWSGDDNFFKVHNWWHRALFHLGLGQPNEALALYDGPIRRDRSAVVLDLIDASALLWRLHLTGHDVGDRWRELAQTWDRHADGGGYPFNDWHAVMAYLGAGRHEDVQRIASAFRTRQGGESADWARGVGLQLVSGFDAFWRGDYRAAVDYLIGSRHIANMFGGSHAQRDIIDWTLTEAAVRGGQSDLAEALANERLAVKPHSPVNRDFLLRARSYAERRSAA
jgi:tetratricopeptide (TPR) repeat protein